MVKKTVKVSMMNMMTTTEYDNVKFPPIMTHSHPVGIFR